MGWYMGRHCTEHLFVGSAHDVHCYGSGTERGPCTARGCGEEEDVRLLGSSSELALGNNDRVVDETVEIAADTITLDVHEDEGRNNIRSAGRESTGGTARIDEELAVLLKALKVMCVSCDQNITVELPLKCGEGIAVTPWNNIVAVAKTNAELLHLNNLRLGPRLRSLRLIKFTANNVNIRGNATKIIIHLLCAKIARAENSVNLARNKKSLEFCRDLMST